MNHRFFNKNTQFDPNYRNIQSELWALLSDDQQVTIASVFKHLKNHAQIEISEALIDYIKSDYTEIPDAIDWSDITIGATFYMILNRVFDVEIDEIFPSVKSNH